MTVKQFPLLTCLIFVCGFLLFGCTADPKPATPRKTEQQATDNTPKNRIVPETPEPIQIYGEVQPEQSLKVQFEIGGLLEAGELSLQAGTIFRKNQLLFQLNNAAAFRVFNAGRQQLANHVQILLPAVQKNFPAELDKWNAFLLALGPENLLPEFPQLNSKKEQEFAADQNLEAQHLGLMQMQNNMRQHFYLAPFDGSIAEIRVQPGQTVSSGQTIAVLSEKGKHTWTATISIADKKILQAHPQLDFRNAKGEIVATGKWMRSAQPHQLNYRIAPQKGHKITNGEVLRTTVPAN